MTSKGYRITGRCAWCEPKHILGYKWGGLKPGEISDGMCPKAERRIERDRKQRKERDS